MEVLQRRVIQEDTVLYKLFLVSATEPSRTEARLVELIEEIFGKFAAILAQYIWHHQPFNLKYFPGKGTVIIYFMFIVCEGFNYERHNVITKYESRGSHN